MAELATPSAATMGTINAGADGPPSAKAAFSSKPERPDEEAYKKELAEAEKALTSIQEKQKAIKSKLDLAQPKNQDSPINKRRAELMEERNQIRTTQQAGKSSRGQVLDKIKRLDEQLKSMLAESKTARGRVPFKSADEVQQHIDRLQKSVDAGTMKIVDEKKALAEISQLNKQKKTFAGFDDSQKKIDVVKAQIAELRKSMDDPESKALSDRYSAISAELDQIKAEQDEVYKNLNSLRDQRTKIHEEQQTKWQAVKDIKDKYYQAKRTHAEYEREARKIRFEKSKSEREAFEAGKRKAVAQQKLEDASAPAYTDEILTAQGLIRYFDPSSAEAKAAAGPGKFAAQASRTVDESGFKGTKLARKGEEEENYFAGTGGKKNKGRKGRVDAPAPANEKFNMSIGVIEELAKLSVDPPTSSSDIPATVEKLKQKLAHWKEDQDRKTKENIAKAQKEIDRLEAEVDGEKSGTTNGHASAGAEQVNGDAKDITEQLEKARIEDVGAPES